MTALDQQMTVMEGKLTRSLAESDRGKGGDITREEVARIVREGQNNPARGKINIPRNLKKLWFSDAQVQSVVDEVQNIIGQVRELGMQVRETGDRVRRVQGETNEHTERYGVELAEAISRVETVRRNCLLICVLKLKHLLARKTGCDSSHQAPGWAGSCF